MVSTEGKHIMLSYQRKSEDIVLKMYDYLKENQSIPIWMDQHGGVTKYLSTRFIFKFSQHQFDSSSFFFCLV